MAQVKLVSMRNPRLAAAFVDYIKTLEIEIEANIINAEATELFVAREDLPAAKAALEEFMENPGDSKFLSASWKTGETGRDLRYQSIGPSFTESFLSHAGVVTLSILGLCVVIYLFRFEPQLYASMWFPADAGFSNGEIWRWVTPALIHFSAMHIVFNLLWWWYLGGQVEQRFSSLFLLLFMLFAAIVSNYAQFATSGSFRFGGLSGVVYALIGYCWAYGRIVPEDGVKLKDEYFVFSLVWLMIGYLDLLWINFANSAHLAGLMAGLLFAWLASKIRSSDIP